MIVFRWSMWSPNPETLLLLNHSIGTFQHFFGDEAKYVVFTDDPTLQGQLKVDAKVYLYHSFDTPDYLEPAITWRKWAPRCRYYQDAIELRIDIDMFLVADPVEIKEFCRSGKCDYLITVENFKELWPYGNFSKLLEPEFIPINAGLVGQHVGADISDLLSKAYQWWKENIGHDEIKYHDEQGAVAFIFQPLIKRGEVMLLPPERYRVVCPLNDPPVESLQNIVLLHATYPEHPAFYQFLPEISRISRIRE